MNTLRFVSNNKLLQTCLVVAAAMTLAVGTAYGGTDTTFTPLATKISGWLSG